jgi:hypothetical protein
MTGYPAPPLIHSAPEVVGASAYGAGMHTSSGSAP